MADPKPGRRVVATSPVRVADVGGWTDTWFGSPGRVCHVAVGPGVRVKAGLLDPASSEDGGRPVRILAPDLGEDYRCGPAADQRWVAPEPGRHPLLEHAIGSVMAQVVLPPEVALELTVTSAVPPGASLGTSAAVVVAVLGALHALFGGPQPAPAELAVAAHEVETVRAGREAGVQDQWAAAMGGCGVVAVGPYPRVRHHPISLAPAVAAELGARLVTVAFGPHDSSSVHAEVINAVVGCGGEAHDQARRCLRRLAALADDAAGALGAGEVDAWAQVLTAATEAQRALHPALVGPAHQMAIDVARAEGATGWKVNGAGGTGGSLTMVTAAPAAATALAERLAAVDPTWRVLDLRPAPGLQVERIPG